jgi:hypothetical protein
VSQLRRERRALGRRAKPNLGVDGERRELLALRLDAPSIPPTSRTTRAASAIR